MRSFCKKKAETSNNVVPFNEDSKQQMKMTPICFTKRNNEIKETTVFCLMKTRNQNVRSCKQNCYKERHLLVSYWTSIEAVN